MGALPEGNLEANNLLIGAPGQFDTVLKELKALVLHLRYGGELIHGAANRIPLSASVDVEAPAPTRPPLAQGEPRLLGARVRVGISDLDGELLVHASELTDPLGCEPCPRRSCRPWPEACSQPRTDRRSWEVAWP